MEEETAAGSQSQTKTSELSDGLTAAGYYFLAAAVVSSNQHFRNSRCNK